MDFQAARVSLKIFLLSLFALGMSLSWAEVRLDNTRTWRRATLIAPGQQVWSVQSSYQDVSNRFGQNGQVQPVGAQYSRSLTWDQLVRADNVGKAEIKGYMKQNGLNGGDVAATSTYEVHRQDIGFGVDWAYGLTERWMIGVQIPITLRRTRVEQHVEMTPALSRGAGQAGQKSLLALKNRDLGARVKQLAQDQLTTLGYDRIPEQKQSWDFGDVSLLSQFSLFDSYHWNWALQETMRFPTAQNSSVSDYIQNSTDEGAVNLGLTSVLDYQVRRWTYGFRLGYVAQLPDSTRMRVADGSANGGSQVDPKVNRKLGDWGFTALDAEYRFSRKWDFNAEYSYLMKGKDHYSGNTYADVDYAQLSEGTEQRLHQTRVGVVYRLGPESSRSGVMNKWVTEVAYSYPWIGRNSNDAAQTSLELINYF